MLAVAAAFPATALAGTVTGSISAGAGDVVAGSTVQVVCVAESAPAGGMSSEATQLLAITATWPDGSAAGTVAPSTFATASNVTCSSGTGTCSVISGTAAWTTPATPGALKVTCTGTFKAFRTTTGEWTGPLTTVAGSALPPAISAVNGPVEVAVGTSNVFEAVASDPNTPAQTLSYAWTATGGTVTPNATNPAQVAWEAPGTTGQYKLTVTASNGSSSSSLERTVNVALATRQASLPLPLGAPRRLAASGAAGLFVVDGQRQTDTTGTISLVTARGEARGFAALPEPGIAVAAGNGSLWATTTKGSIYQIDPVTGRNLGKIPLAPASFARPAGIAYDAVNTRIWVADSNAYRVRVVHPDGRTLATITGIGGYPFRTGLNPTDPTDTQGQSAAPVDVAIDEASGKALVLLQQAMEPSSARPVKPYVVHAFNLADYTYAGSFVKSGSGVGQVTAGGGIVVGAARVYVSDAYQGAVQVVSTAGTPVATIGTWGSAEGQLSNPAGVALMANGDLAVANFSGGTVERFGAGAPLPTCAGDADCDLLPDDWETANKLNKDWAGDGLLDLDLDGLNNAQELAAGTNPGSPDTDGDGFSDAAELATGFDPRNPTDHLARVEARFPAETAPGLVKLSAVVSGPGACSVGWAQKGGPHVTLADAETLNPSFVARAAGSYAFDAVANCGGQMSPPGTATVVVKNVPPIAEAGRVVVASPGTPIRLDALASSDANGDALAFAWDQTLGAALVGSETGASLTARPRGAGLYAFQVTVTDPGGARSTAEVPVLVAEGQAPTAIAAALPGDAQVGSTVVLDASTSLVPRGATFSWQQVAGPVAALGGANEAVASFAPAVPGRYAFEVTAGVGPLRSPPARVEVFASPDGTLPTVSAAAPPAIVAVGQPVSLEAAPSPSSASVAWRQISGPAAGLTNGDAAAATVVPFVAGFHVFEASVKDGAVEGHPTRVAFEARAGGNAIPQARVQTPPGDAWVGQLVFLDGRGSTGAARYRWSQVGGPWVAFSTQGSVATFRPLAVGRYAFELVVDDGVTRSAPAAVEVNVVSGEVQ